MRHVSQQGLSLGRHCIRTHPDPPGADVAVLYNETVEEQRKALHAK